MHHGAPELYCAKGVQDLRASAQATSQSLQGVLIPDSVKTGATSYKPELKLDRLQAIQYKIL